VIAVEGKEKKKKIKSYTCRRKGAKERRQTKMKGTVKKNGGRRLSF
jgi:hypothetical protein